MTITSVGYAGDVTAADWAALVPRAGSSRYGVDGWNDFRVSTAAGTRTVQIASGAAWGYGVRDKNSAPVTLALGAAVSGVRWWLIAARRDWSAGSTTIVAVDAGAAKAIPSHNENPGTLDDQPLALVRVGTGAAIAEVIDLRVVPRDGGAQAFDDLARSYMDRPGTVLRLPSGVWRRVYDASGNIVWISPSSASWTDIPHLATAQNAGGMYPFGYQVAPGGVYLRGASQKKTGGWGGGNQIGLLPAPARPTQTVELVCWSSAAGQLAQVHITPAGAVIFDWAVGGTGVGPARISFDGLFVPQG